MVDFERKPVEGVVPLLPLSLTPDQEIDYDGIRSNIELLEEFGMDGFITFGTMGQFYNVSEKEFDEICDVCVNAADDLACVIGTTSPNTREAIRRTTYAEDAGADGAMLATPYAANTNEKLAIKFYQDVDAALSGELAVMLYNHEAIGGVNITPDMWLDELVGLESVRAVKESNHSSPHHHKTVKEIASDISVFPGNDVQFYSDSQVGARGILGILAWAAPQATLQWYEDCMENRHHEPQTKDTYKRFVDAWYTIEQLHSLDGYYKAATLNTLAESSGAVGGPIRDPYERYAEQEEKRLQSAIAPLKELEESVT